MKKSVALLVLLCLTVVAFSQSTPLAENVILVTFDGYRWQELFGGAQKKLLHSKKNVKQNAEALKAKYWRDEEDERKRVLNPFFWNVVAKEGVLAGHRHRGSRVQVANPYRFSYPGYSEMFCGKVDRKVNSNDYPDNPNTTVFDVVQKDARYTGQLAAFATWDAFPRIINTKRNMVPVFVNFKKQGNSLSSNGTTYQEWQSSIPASNPLVSTDTLTYRFAKEYIHRNHPRLVFIGFDETDHFAHEGNYDAYLESANLLNNYLADLWSYLQSDEHYRGKTTLIVTCDHGRGRIGTRAWRHHGQGIVVANQTWIAAIGPGIQPLGELKEGKHYQKQIAATVAKLLGVAFEGAAPVLSFVK